MTIILTFLPLFFRLLPQTVSGVPEPRDDHAVVMARFAKSCMERFHPLIRRLAIELGPETANLKLRVGLHSGPVTGGVLRGTKARYQLFGGTVNAAARIERYDCISGWYSRSRNRSLRTPFSSSQHKSSRQDSGLR